MKKILSIALLSALFIVAFAGCNQQTTTNTDLNTDNVNKPADEVKTGESTPQDESIKKTEYNTLKDASDAAILALKNNDMNTLSEIASDKGVRFSPYSFINVNTDVVLDPVVLKNVQMLSRTFIWGTYDGSGEKIDLPFGQYYEKFVYDKDFMNAPDIKFNEIIGQGNTVNNLKDVYPDAEFVEYHFPGFDKQYDGMDWESLRLVFEKKDGNYYLVGIVHDGWTI